MSDMAAIARAWIGTPYHHQASLRGVGCDCLGLVRGVLREAFALDIPFQADYARDWADASGVESMLEGARRHLIEIDAAELRAGDVVVFRFRAGAIAKHAGVLTSATTFIHAMENGPAIEAALSPWWRRRIAGVFRAPGRAA